MKQVLGTNLSPENQKRALAAYVHRFTADHVPNWAREALQRVLRYVEDLS